MKLATFKSPHRDGRLVVVDRELKSARPVPHIAANLQDALDRWREVEPALQAAYHDLCAQSLNGDLA